MTEDRVRVEGEAGDAWEELPDLLAERTGGAALWANDEFFAPAARLVAAGAPEWREGLYTERGKWMDGWETRRRREPGHDTCILRLGLPGTPRGVVVDTTHFRGNAPAACTLHGVDLPGHPPLAALLAPELAWRELLPRTPLAPHTRNAFPLAAGDDRVTHVRLSIFPDGGVARLRLHGEVGPDWAELARRGEVDLAAVENGGRVLAASDEFFGSRHHLLLPGPPHGMHDGWETRRRRDDGHDWALVALGRPCTLRRAEVDTSFFRGNAPGACSLVACAPGAFAGTATEWRELLPQTPLQPHTRHELALPEGFGPVSHVRLAIFPDGGVARLRLFGRPGDGAR